MYKKTIWKNQDVENPRNFRILDNVDGSKQILDDFGEVVELGTPVNAENMNKIEDGIANCAIRYYLENETYRKNEWVLGENNDKKEIYQSLIEDNLNNELSNSNAWKKVNFGFLIGQPIITLDNSLEENEIWLEGAEVSKANYPNLYAIYGDTYGAPSDTNNFILPDFRNRAIWGADGFGYLEAGLPNITGTIAFSGLQWVSNATGVFTSSTLSNGNTAPHQSSTRYRLNLDASSSNSIYGNSETVQPPAIKVRVKTKFE